MEQEKFKLCEVKQIKNSKGEKMQYLVIYSSYEILEKLYITEELYNQFKANENKIDINQLVFRGYDTFNKKFKLYLRK